MLDYKTLIKNYSSIYIQGNSGIGKTTKLINFLDENDYNYSYSYIQNIRTEQDFLNLLNNVNIMKCFFKKYKKNKRIIIIDNLDYLQNNDKKILTIIVKYLKVKSKEVNQNNDLCLIFLGINKNEKKIIELYSIVDKYIQLSQNDNELFYDKNMKENVKDLICKNYKKSKNVNSEKTIISLCYHENIIYNIKNNYKLYENILLNFCNGDYYDRIAFQKQLWQFNEMTYFLKVLSSYDNHIEYNKNVHNYDNEIIFTKILTKYSNEYSNYNFVISLCNKLNIQKNELFHIVINKEPEQLSKYFKSIINTVEEKRLIKLIS